MTILAASQQAIMRLVGTKPAAVVSSTDAICVEMTALAMEAAQEIASANDWQALTSFHTITANGTDEAYPMPDDYDRMVQATELYDPANWCWGYHHVINQGDWLQYQISNYGMISPGIWTMRQNQFHFLPKPASGRQAIFPYVSKNIFRDTNGAPKAVITSDTDEFVLDERLLTLALIWKWLALKRMDYQQEVDDYNIAMSEAATRDKGARVIRKGTPRRAMNIGLAWPWELGAP